MLHDVSIVRATVDQIVFRDDRAVGVSIIKNGSRSVLRSRRGVILCGGAIATPTILMRSGVGDSGELSRHGIEVRVNSPMVGRNLKDHLVMPVIYEMNLGERFRLDPSPRDIARWQVLGTGPVASNVAECGGLFHRGEFQVHVTPTNYLTFPAESKASMMTLAVNVTHPNSCGRITIQSIDANSPPTIFPNYLSDAADGERLCTGVAIIRELAERSPLSDSIVKEVIPGKRRCDDRAVMQSITRFAQTLYHPIGTCSLGQSSENPLDVEFGVRGTRELWVADGSALPELTTGNPMAAVMTWAIIAANAIASQHRS